MDLVGRWGGKGGGGLSCSLIDFIVDKALSILLRGYCSLEESHVAKINPAPAAREGYPDT